MYRTPNTIQYMILSVNSRHTSLPLNVLLFCVILKNAHRIEEGIDAAHQIPVTSQLFTRKTHDNREGPNSTQHMIHEKRRSIHASSDTRMFSFLLKRVKGSRDHDHHERILIDSNCLSSADNCSSILFRMTSMQQVEITMTTVCLPPPFLSPLSFPPIASQRTERSLRSHMMEKTSPFTHD